MSATNGVLRVGLTGGIGSGKSTVARMLNDRGAVVIDADRLAREVVEPGEPALDEIAARFGDHLIDADGGLDRAGLAAIVFADDGARTDLEEITHPRIGERMASRYVAAVRAADGDDVTVVLDHPLLVETGLHTSQDVVVVVVADEELRVTRLVERGLPEEDARARMRSQATDDERAAVADHVLDNNGDLQDLEEQVATLWSALRQLAPEGVDGTAGRDTDEPDV